MTERDENAPGDEDLFDNGLLDDEPAAVREELRRKLKTEGARVAYETMVAVARDPKAQASARATCAVALFRGAGFLGKRADEEDAADGKTLDQMTDAEMQRELQRLRTQRLHGRRRGSRRNAPDDSVFD